jgi:Thrombospondin type 3 repeat
MLNCAKSSASLLLALMLMLGAVFPAAARADFGSTDLILSIYDNVTTEGNTEFGMDTGLDLHEVDWTKAVDEHIATGLDLNWWKDGTAWSDLQVGLFAASQYVEGSAYGRFYAATTAVNNTLNAAATQSFNGAVVQTLEFGYRPADGQDLVVSGRTITGEAGKAYLANNLNDIGYDKNLNVTNGIAAAYGTLNAAPGADMEGNLAGFGTADTSDDTITMYLYGVYADGWMATQKGPLTNGILKDGNGDPLQYLATVTLSKDGTLTIKNNYPCGVDQAGSDANDTDHDGWCNASYQGSVPDNCPNTENPDQADADGNGIGDACEAACPDADNDGICDDADNCPAIANPDQADWNSDGEGDACDDSDGDGTMDDVDQCKEDPAKTIPGQCGCGNAETPGCTSGDLDGDGMPDDWETANGLDPNDATGDNGAAGDLDKDGFTNIQEYKSGTLPNNAASHPTRPTVTAPGQTVDANTDVTLQATATQGTNTLVFFTWTQTAGDAVIESPKNTNPDAGATTSSLTFKAPAMGQNDPDLTLTFELTATDSVGIASDPPKTVTVTVQATGDNSPPDPPPTVNAPANDAQVTSLPLDLSVHNTQDADGDPIFIRFTVADDPGVDAGGILTSPLDHSIPPLEAAQTGGATGTTKVQYPDNADLLEDTFYYWQAAACNEPDGADPVCSRPDMDGKQSRYARFFVNTVNAPPNTPLLTAPEDAGRVASATPAFSVDLQPYAADDNTDYFDNHTYTLEISSNKQFTDSMVPPGATWNTFTCQAGATDAGGCKSHAQWEIAASGLNLVEDTTYYWRVAYQDDGAGSQPLHTAARSFIFNMTTEAPNAPTELTPADGAVLHQLPATLTFKNNGDPDNENQDLTYTVTLATSADLSGVVETINDQSLFTTAGDQVSVTVSDLVEDQTYWWRVTVADPDQNAANSTTVKFRVNAENAPPDAPANPTPADGEVWHALAPTFSVDSTEDPDGDAVTYRFELFSADNFDDPIADSGVEPIDHPQWTLGKAAALENNTKYAWRVTAYDPNGASTQSKPFEFTTSVNFYQAAVPTLNNPFGGGTVSDLMPTLSVFRSADDTGDGPLNFTYNIELYSDVSLSRTVLLSDPEVGERLVSAQALVALEEGHTYYWRARVNNGTHPSAWMPTASFTVDTNGEVPYDVQIELSQIARFDTVDTQVFTLTQDAGSLTGLRVEIPPGALTPDGGDINFIIGKATRVPAIPVGTALVGDAIFLAPEGLTFADFVNIRIPVVPPGDEAPEDIRVLTYDLALRSWVPVDSTLSQDKLTVNVAVPHFSLYAMVMDDPISTAGSTTTSGSGGGSSGLGSCFINSLGD